MKRLIRDWNDIKILHACKELGSFSAVAAELGMDQVTVSRKIAALETLAGRPLFTRKRSGAKPTPAGLKVLEVVDRLAHTFHELETTLLNLDDAGMDTVTLAAPEGILNFLIKPVLADGISGPLDGRSLLQADLPPIILKEWTPTDQSDIRIIPSSYETLPKISGRYRVRRIATMTFLPFGSRTYLNSSRPISRFDDLKNEEIALIDNQTYRGLSSMADWHGIITERRSSNIIVATNTTQAAHPLKQSKGLSLMPGYSPAFDADGVVLDIAVPRMAVSLWAVAHEDRLREPAIRFLYDEFARMFLSSPWFR